MSLGKNYGNLFKVIAAAVMIVALVVAGVYLGRESEERRRLYEVLTALQDRLVEHFVNGESVMQYGGLTTGGGVVSGYRPELKPEGASAVLLVGVPGRMKLSPLV